jgi:TnpA family transposase
MYDLTNVSWYTITADTMPVSFLTDNERKQLQNFPTDISADDVNTFFTLSATDMTLVQKQRGPHNRLGFSLQLCTLRYLGFPLQKIMALPERVVSYVANQLNVTAADLPKYGNRGPTRTVDAQAIQEYLGFRKATADDLHKVSDWLLERALEHDKPSLLLRLLSEKLYQEKIVRPGISLLERMVATARAKVQAETYKRLSPLITPESRRWLDSLLVSNETTHHTLISWIGKGITSNSAAAVVFCLEKLAFLREQHVDEWDMSPLTPNRLKFLATIAKRSTNQAMQRMPEERRYPIILAYLNQSLIDITDETIEIFDHCLWDCYNGAKNDLEAFKKEVYKSSNEKVRVLGEVGKLVLDPDIKDQELRESIFTYLPQGKLQSVIEECAKIVRPSNDKYYDFLSTRYSYLRQFVPKFLSGFEFHSNIADDPLSKAVTVLRTLNNSKQRKLPDSAPLEFITDDWLRYVVGSDGKLNRRFYELCVL